MFKRVRPRQRRVLIVGGGMAGMAAAMRLAGRVELTLADPSPWFEWLPNIHELISGEKTPGDLRIARADLLDRLGVRYLPVAVSRLDGHRGEVHFADGISDRFDALVLAVGGVNNTLGVSGSDQFAMPFKSVEQCHRIGERLRVAMAAGGCRVVLVGAGVEGVEALGEILRRYRHQPGLQVNWVDSAPRLLGAAPAQVDQWLRQHLAGLPVALQLGERIVAVEQDRVLLRSGAELSADLVIWTGGVAPPPLLHESGLARPGDWLAVNEDLQAAAAPRLWVAGDVAGVPGLEKQAYHALAMGELAADNLLAWLRGRPRRAFVPVPKPMLVTFGDLDCYLVAGEHVAAGAALGELKELIYLVNMAALERPRGLRALTGTLVRLRATLSARLGRDWWRSGLLWRLPIMRIKI